jgi:hypothetical protein
MFFISLLIRNFLQPRLLYEVQKGENQMMENGDGMADIP